MNGVNSYSAYQNSYSEVAVQNRESSAKAGRKSATGSAGQPKLSDKAQALLEKLRKQYGDMDFMVAGKGDNAKEMLSRGTKEFSVLFTEEEIEKMASDSKYAKERMDRVKGAVRMSEQINRQYGFGPASEKGEITKIGISFNSDGSTSYFAELEKMSEKQRERIEKAREQKSSGKDPYVRSKRVQVSASSMKELIDKMNKIDWTSIKEEGREGSGYKFNYSI